MSRVIQCNAIMSRNVQARPLQEGGFNPPLTGQDYNFADYAIADYS